MIIRFMILLSTALLAACQSSGPKLNDKGSVGREWSNDVSVFTDKVAMVERQSGWSLQGKVAVSGGALRESANMVWRAENENGSLRLYGPLGAGAVVIDYDSSGARLVDGKKQEVQGSSVEDVLLQSLGWYVPLDALVFWVQGTPNPKYAYQYRLGGSEELVDLEQLGWKLSFSKYYKGQNDRVLPRKITARRMMLIDGVQQEMTVRIIVKSFQTGLSSHKQ